MGLRLHPKHGVNPTVPICMFCGKDKSQVVLLGAAYKGEAPMHMLLDADPCEECQKKASEYVFLAEAEVSAEGKPRFTGRGAMVRRSIVTMLFKPEAMARDILAQGRALIEPEAYRALQDKANEPTQAEVG